MATDPPRNPAAASTPCRLYSFNLTGGPSVSLESLPTLIPQVHLYSDGGIDISADGQFILACAMLQVPTGAEPNYRLQDSFKSGSLLNPSDISICFSDLRRDDLNDSGIDVRTEERLCLFHLRPRDQTVADSVPYLQLASSKVKSTSSCAFI